MGRKSYLHMSSARHSLAEDPWKRKRREQIDQSPYNLPNVDVHGLIFAVLAVVFVIYPLAQWALGR